MSSWGFFMMFILLFYCSYFNFNFYEKNIFPFYYWSGVYH